MKIVRVFSGDDGESHFEDVTPEERGDIANRLGEAIFSSMPARPPPSPITTPRPGANMSCTCWAGRNTSAPMVAKPRWVRETS